MDTYIAFVNKTEGCDDFAEVGEADSEQEAVAILERSLEELHPGQWKLDGQWKFVSDVPGNYVAGYITTRKAIADEQREAEEWRAAEPERKRYGIYGRSGFYAIKRDALKLARVATLPEIMQNTDGMWRRFVEAGGDDSHSGASFWCVRSEAATLLTRYERMKSAQQQPAD